MKVKELLKSLQAASPSQKLVDLIRNIPIIQEKRPWEQNNQIDKAMIDRDFE